MRWVARNVARGDTARELRWADVTADADDGRPVTVERPGYLGD